MVRDIIGKLKNSGLVGRGGACFPTWMKWLSVKTADGDKKYIVVNGSEGEPGARKDRYIIENYPKRVIHGIKLAINYLPADKAYFYLNYDYYGKFAPVLNRAIGDYPIEIVRKHKDSGYIGGEETSILNSIEGRRVEPRLRPPFPPQKGLFGYPTLVNNVETFYEVSLIARGEYDHQRFYTIGGDCVWTGVKELPEDWSIARILRHTDNYPDYDFFVQAGGDAGGVVLNSIQLDRPVGGCGSITIYSVAKHEPIALIKSWIEFFAGQSCGQCTPCREGTYRLRELFSKSEISWGKVAEIILTLKATSFCGLGCVVPVPIESYLKNVFMDLPGDKYNITPETKQSVCECFK